MKISIDRNLITDQMNTLGLSERTIISRTGIPGSSFRTARLEGHLESSLSLTKVHALAEVLGLTMADLLANTEEEAPVEHAKTASEDAAELIPLLVQVPRMLAIDQFARAPGWDLKHLLDALDAIPTALDGTGLRLHRKHGQIRILPAVKRDLQMQRALLRVRSTGRDLNKTEMAVLTRVINGENVLDRQPSNQTRVAIGSLKNLGCTTLNNDGIFTVSDELRLALPDL